MAPGVMAGGIFVAYRLFSAAATPLVRRHLRQRVARGREDPARLAERFGHAGVARPPGPLVWVHGASVGESLSALPLVDGIREGWPGLNLLMTTGTVTSARLMAERLPEGVIHQYLPVDLPAAVGRFLAHWRPALGLMVESEFWPNLLLQARAGGVDLALVNGRVSGGSYASWRRFRPLIGHLLRQFSITLAQSREDQAHLRDLGAADPLRLGNLKFAAPPLAAVASLGEVLEACDELYLAEGLRSFRAIPDSSCDLVWSHAVLEHIRRAEFPEVMRELHRNMKPTGIGSHRVDPQDHLAGALNNLRFPEGL